MTYTPTTEKMFEAYYNFLRHTSRSSRDAQAEFDRWLAEHDRKVSEQVWEEGHEAGFNDSFTEAGEYNSPNPYREAKNASLETKVEEAKSRNRKRIAEETRLLLTGHKEASPHLEGDN